MPPGIEDMLGRLIGRRSVASLVIIAAPHLEMLLRCMFHGREYWSRAAIDRSSPTH
jgi:hypothetical protein